MSVVYIICLIIKKINELTNGLNMTRLMSQFESNCQLKIFMQNQVYFKTK